MSSQAKTTSEARTTSKNITSVIIFKGLQYPVLLVSMMLIPRTMGAETYGVYAHLMSILVISISLIEFGTGATFARFISEYKANGDISSIKKLSTNMLVLKFFLVLFASIVLLLVLSFLYSHQYPFSYFLLIILALILHDIGTIPYALLFGLNQLGKVAIREPIRRVLNLLFILILFYYYGLFGAILANVLAQIFLIALAFYWGRGYFSFKKFKFDNSFLKPYLKFEFLYFFSSMLSTASLRLGNPLIEKITGESREVALFDIPNTIFTIILSFITIIVESLIPIFSKLLLDGKEEKIINWSKVITKYLGILCTIIIGGYILAGPDLIPLIIGSEYSDIYPNGLVLMLGLFPMIIIQLGVIYGVVYRSLKKYLLALCISFLVFIIASILLIQDYASLGCSIAVLISCIVLAVTMFLSYREKLSPVLSDFLRAILPGIIFIPFIFFKENIIINLSLSAVSIVLYIFLLFFTKILKVDEIKEIIKAIRYKSPDFVSE